MCSKIHAGETGLAHDRCRLHTTSPHVKHVRQNSYLAVYCKVCVVYSALVVEGLIVR